MNVVVTGGAGFIGHYVVDELLHSHKVIVIDSLTYAGSMRRLEYIGFKGTTLTHDIRLPFNDNELELFKNVDVIVHMAAETHVDRSVQNPQLFIDTNVTGTLNMLDAAERISMKYARDVKFMYFSTDEVYGPARELPHNENDQLTPTNPYAATKAAGEMMVRAFGNTHRIPYCITRCMNVVGQRQNQEKFVPKATAYALTGKSIPVHCDENGVIGYRDYIHASKVAKIVSELLAHKWAFDTRGAVWNIRGDWRLTNEQVALRAAKALNKEVWVHKAPWDESRPWHDHAYSVDGSRLIKLLGDTVSKVPDIDMLDEDIRWYAENQEWLM